MSHELILCLRTRRPCSCVFRCYKYCYWAYSCYWLICAMEACQHCS